MGKKRVQVGDIVLIPVGNGFVPGKVLFVSAYFKNLILLGIYRLRQSEKVMPNHLPDDFAEKIYTGIQPITQERWFRVGHEDLRPSQEGLSKRIVGGDVWFEDQHLGLATTQDLSNLPKMDACGAALVEKKVARIEIPA